MDLSVEQQDLLEFPIHSKIFLQGMAGSGKTTAGTNWLKKLLKAGVPAQEILIYVPQRALAKPYELKLLEIMGIANSLINTLTLGGLARRMVDLFWPLISHSSGVLNPDQPPHFLTMETAQYYMAHIVRPRIEDQGFFNSLTINRNRIYAQILDNLNKAAVMGFPYEQVGERLKSAWVGDIEQYHIFDDLQVCLEAFRTFCLENNLLDFSLQVEIFHKHLWDSPVCKAYLRRSFRHLIADNIEEDTPVSHEILKAWLPEFDSALLIFDENAGFRYFLGADVQSALSLRKLCDEHIK
ncbi:MAG: UvrD-helicase domain-containing protein, partial [Anaerolineales bacterium]